MYNDIVDVCCMQTHHFSIRFTLTSEFMWQTVSVGDNAITCIKIE